MSTNTLQHEYFELCVVVLNRQFDVFVYAIHLHSFRQSKQSQQYVSVKDLFPKSTQNNWASGWPHQRKADLFAKMEKATEVAFGSIYILHIHIYIYI